MDQLRRLLLKVELPTLSWEIPGDLGVQEPREGIVWGGEGLQLIIMP